MEQERGSATIETVGSIVTLALFLAVILQIVLVANAFLTAGHATREGVRAAALGHPDTGVVYLVATVAGIPPNEADVQITPRPRIAGDLVTVRFTVEVLRLPVLSAILPELTITARSIARAEVAFG